MSNFDLTQFVVLDLYETLLQKDDSDTALDLYFPLFLEYTYNMLLDRATKGFDWKHRINGVDVKDRLIEIIRTVTAHKLPDGYEVVSLIIDAQDNIELTVQGPETEEKYLGQTFGHAFNYILAKIETGESVEQVEV